MTSPRHCFALGLLIALAPELSAQCADGTPPPCDARRPATLTSARPAAVPSSIERGKRFLILPFRNVTRQPDQEWLVEGSTALLVDALSRWQGISVVPDEKLYPALKRVQITPGQIAPEDRVKRVAEETGGWTAVTGDVLATGGRIRISARAWDVPTGKELVHASTDVATGGDVRAAFDSLSLKLLRTAGIDSAGADLAATTTRNVDAYKAYVNGNALTRRAEIKPAIEEMQKAVRLDSNFAMGWARLAELSAVADPASIMNPQSNLLRYSARAVSLASKLPPKDRDLVLANDAFFGAQFVKARALLEGLLARDSTDVEAMTLLTNVEMADFVLTGPPGSQRPRGSRNRAVRLAKRVLELDPSRQTMYSMLAGTYALAGVPGSQPAIGIDQEPSSFPDLMRLTQQRQHLRVYYPLLRDSLILVPAESLSFIPRDTIDALRKNARDAVRGWVERWVAVAPNDAAPYVSLSGVDAIDHDFRGALKAIEKADSIGVHIPTLSVPVVRMTYLARLGDLRAASRLADSITATPFFASPSNMLQNRDAASWAFALQLISGRYARATTLFDQALADWLSLSPTMQQPEFSTFANLMGNDDPRQEPGIARTVRGMELDSVAAHVNEAAGTKLAPFLSLLLSQVAVDADTTGRRIPELLKAADRLAAAGHTQLAFEVAAEAVANDSTLEPEAAKAAWYRTAAEAYNAVKRTTAARFHADSAIVSADRAVFQWKVDDAAPFTRDRAESPPMRNEYRWSVMINDGSRALRVFAVAEPRKPGGAPKSGTLSELLSTARRYFAVGRVLATGEQSALAQQQGISVQTEVAPGTLRLVVTDKAILEELRSAKPATATFRFEPCIRPVGSAGSLQCFDTKVPISYR